MLHWFGAFIFLGGIGGVVIILIITYICIKRQLCWCQKQTKSSDTGDGDEPLLDKFYDNNTEDCTVAPYNKVLVNEQCGPGEFNYVVTHPSDIQTPGNVPSDVLTPLPNPYMSVSVKGSSDDILKALPSAYLSVKRHTDSPLTSETESSQVDKGEIIAKKRKKVVFVDGCNLKMSLLYSKGDYVLMLTINEVTGMPTKVAGGYSHIRLSTTLMPDKKYRTKTVWHMTNEDDVVVFGDSFKFSNLNRQTLLASSFRFRLYGKNGTREACVGEMFVQLAEVAQRSGGFVTWKKFDQKELKKK